jgi:hypothetical protein
MKQPLIPFWMNCFELFFWGWEMKQPPNSVLNCFGDENWSNPWIRPNRHPSRWGGGHGRGTSHLPFFIYYLSEVTFFHLSYFLLGGHGWGDAWAGGPEGGASRGKDRAKGGGRAGDFPVAEGHGYPHQCLSRQRTQRVHASNHLTIVR